MNKFTASLLLLCIVGQPGCASIQSKAFPRLGQRHSEATERGLSMARLMERHGKYDEALKLYQNILEQDPKHQVASHRMGILAVRRGEHDMALDYFETAGKKGKPSAELLSDIGYTRYLMNELDVAEETLRAALRANPQLGSARTNLGLVLAEQGRDDEALVEFRKAGSEASALSNLAYIQTKLGHLAEAEKNYHRALELDPKQRSAAEALVQFQGVRDKADALVAKVEKNEAKKDREITQAGALEVIDGVRPKQRPSSRIDEKDVEIIAEPATKFPHEVRSKRSAPPVATAWTEEVAEPAQAEVEQPQQADPVSENVETDEVAEASDTERTDTGLTDAALTPANIGWSEPEASPNTATSPPVSKRTKTTWWKGASK